MSRLRKIEYHLRQITELQSIISSMRTLAQLELRKLSVNVEHHREMAEALLGVVDVYYRFFQDQEPPSSRELLLVIGSERGFCGSFNELLVNFLLEGWPGVTSEPQRVLAVGRKLCSQLEERLPGCTGLAGAGTSEELAKILSGIVDTVQTLMVECQANGFRILHHDDESGRVVGTRLLPPERGRHVSVNTVQPLLYLAPHLFFREFLEHYLYLGLIRLFTVSLYAENRYRVEHLGGAVHRLDDKLAVMRNRARLVRQEEITEEIEMILLGSGAFDVRKE